MGALRLNQSEERENLPLMIRALELIERVGGAGHRGRGAAAGHAGAARRAPARGPRGLLLRRDRAVPGRGHLHRRHPAELAALRADERARASGGAGADGGRSGARDPQPAGVDQGRRPGAAADRAGVQRQLDQGVPQHHRRGGRPPEQDRLAVPRLRPALPGRPAGRWTSTTWSARPCSCWRTRRTPSDRDQHRPGRGAAPGARRSPSSCGRCS